jgi:hypothetical protein
MPGKLEVHGVGLKQAVGYIAIAMPTCQRSKNHGFLG